MKPIGITQSSTPVYGIVFAVFALFVVVFTFGIVLFVFGVPFVGFTSAALVSMLIVLVAFGAVYVSSSKSITEMFVADIVAFPTFASLFTLNFKVAISPVEADIVTAANFLLSVFISPDHPFKNVTPVYSKILSS